MTKFLLWALNQLCGWHICYDDKGAMCAIRGNLMFTQHITQPTDEVTK